MSTKLFRDPIHDMIPLTRGEGPGVPIADWGDGLLLDLIDTPEMQRLRRIRQLGLASRVYPAAEHSRFSHALGVMHLTKRLLALLTHHHPDLLTPAEGLWLKTAALLHDVGHGPYSHVFEHLYPGALSHEVWGQRIIQGETRIHHAIHSFARQHGLEHIAMKALAELVPPWLTNPTTGAVAVGRQILSSQLDTDRMDYLLRDALFTGVAYGRFDLEWLLRSLVVAHQEPQGPGLCVNVAKGPAALEHYLTARDQMYRQVYDHKTVRAYEALLTHLFQTYFRLMATTDTVPPGTPPALARFLATANTTAAPALLPDFLSLDDAVLDYAIGQWADWTHPDPGLASELRWKSRMLRDRAPPYRRLGWRLPIHSEMLPNPEAALALQQWCQTWGEELLPIQNPDGGTDAIPLALLVHLDRLERTPYAPFSPAKGIQPIRVLTDAGQVTTAEEVSPLIRFLSQERRMTARLFVDARALVAVTSLLRSTLDHPGLEVAG